MRKTYSRAFWLIAKYQTGEMEVPGTVLARGENALPVFSFEDEAGMFLDLGALGNDWQVRETTAGELTWVLIGAGICRVVLDPLPGPFTEALIDLASMGRKAFIETYLKSEEPSLVAAGLGHRRRQGDVIARRATPMRR